MQQIVIYAWKASAKKMFSSKVFLRKKINFPKVLFRLDFFGLVQETCQFKTIGYLSKMFGSSSVSTGLTTSVAYNVMTQSSHYNVLSNVTA